MILEYTVLWFENDPEYPNLIENDIIEYLQDWGYNARLIIKPDETDLAQIMDKENIDLILMDQNLDKEQQGDTVIKRIRDNELFTEAVLYSEDPKYKQKLSEKQLEGVFFAYRKNLVEKTQKIIDLTIKKNQDIANIRGLFIAETIYLANRMEEILSKILCLTGYSLKFFTDQVVQDEFFTDSAKYFVIQRFLRETTKAIKVKLQSANAKEKLALESLKTRIVEVKTQLKKFEKLMKTRNRLAHSKKCAEEKNVLFIRSNSGNVTKEKYDGKKCKEIREQFLDFSKSLDNLQKLVDDLIKSSIN